MGKEVIIDLKVNSKGADDSLNKTTKSVDNLGTSTTKTSTETSIFGNKMTALKAKLSGFKLGVIQGVRALTTLKGALIATGIGAFVVVLGSLVSFFKRSEDGANTFNTAIAGIKATVDVLLDRFTNLGRGLVSFFSGDFSEAADIFRGAFKGIGDEIAEEFKAAQDIQNILNGVKIAERELNVERAKAQVRINELRVAAEDRTKTDQERITILQEAFDIEEAIFQKELANEKKRAEALQARVDLGESTSDDFEELAAAQVRVADLEAQSLQRNRRIFTQIETLREQSTNEEKARLASEQKALEDLNKKKEELNQKELAQQKSVDDRVRALRNARNLSIIDSELGRLDKQREIALQELDLEALTAQQKADIKLEIDLDYAAKKKEILDKEAADVEEANKIKAADAKLAADNEIALNKAAKDASVDLAVGAIGAIGGLLAEGSKQQKAFAIFETIISTITSAQKAYQSQLTIPSPDAPVRGAIAAGIATAQGLARVAAIRRQKLGSSGGSVGAAGGRSVNFSRLAPNNNPQDVNVLNSNREPMRAFVLNSDINSTAYAAQKIESKTVL